MRDHMTNWFQRFQPLGSSERSARELRDQLLACVTPERDPALVAFEKGDHTPANERGAEPDDRGTCDEETWKACDPPAPGWYHASANGTPAVGYIRYWNGKAWLHPSIFFAGHDAAAILELMARSARKPTACRGKGRVRWLKPYEAPPAPEKAPEKAERQDAWIEWHGGKRPVPGDAKIDWVSRNGGTWVNATAGHLCWRHAYGDGDNAYGDGDIVRYRVRAEP